MKTISAGEFQQRCLLLLDEVRETGEALIVTKRGVPVAQISSPPRQAQEDWEGALSDRGTILGDLVEASSHIEEKQ